MGIRKNMGFPHAPSFANNNNKKGEKMTQYAKQIKQKNLLKGTKKRPGQSGYDGNHELRTKVVQFALSAFEYEKLVEQYMNSDCSTMAVYCREKSLSTGIAVVSKNLVKIETVAELYKLSRATGIAQTGRMGNNLNQIARKLNSNEGFTNFKEKMLEELRLMREMNKKLEAALIEIAGGNL